MRSQPWIVWVEDLLKSNHPSRQAFAELVMNVVEATEAYMSECDPGPDDGFGNEPAIDEVVAMRRTINALQAARKEVE